MPTFPVKPLDVQTIIPSSSASWCAKLLQFPLRLGYLAFNALTFMVKPDGSITDEFKEWIGVTGGGTVVPPGSLTATDGTFTDKVVVTWSVVAGATSYLVYRGTVDDPLLATQIGTVTAATYTDTGVGLVQGTTYRYWIKSTTAGVVSDFSGGDTGYSAAGGVPTSGTLIAEGSSKPDDIVISTAGNYILEAWGSGGGGGASNISSKTGNVWVVYTGGGGGSGAYSKATFALLVGDIISIAITAPGTGGKGVGGSPYPAQSGAPGGSTVINVTRGVASPVSCVTGGGGGGGGVGYPGSQVAGTGGIPSTNSTYHATIPAASTTSGNSGDPGVGLPYTGPPDPTFPPNDGGAAVGSPAHGAGGTGGAGAGNNPGGNGESGFFRISLS